MGHHFGWKVFGIIHSKKTIRTMRTSSISIRIFAGNRASSYRSGFQIARIAATSGRSPGDIKIPRRKDASS
jgi:hypothetical protein